MELVTRLKEEGILSLHTFFHNPRTQNTLALAGLIWTGKWVFKGISAARMVVKIYIVPLFTKERNLAQDFGPWAVVTGATDGVGKEFARQLAARGLNIVLISRSMDKLKAASEEIKREFRVETKIIQVNFSEANLATYDQIEKELEMGTKMEIGLLVNNVGVFINSFQKFGDMEKDILWNHVSVNCGAATMISRIILPHMEKRGKGGIINISSNGSLFPWPSLGAYSCSKIYIDYLSGVIQSEYQKSGIVTLNLNPGGITTKMVGFLEAYKKPSFFAPSPQTYVKSALSHFGKIHATAGYFPHAIETWQFAVFRTSWLF